MLLEGIVSICKVPIAYGGPSKAGLGQKGCMRLDDDDNNDDDDDGDDDGGGDDDNAGGDDDGADDNDDADGGGDSALITISFEKSFFVQCIR